MARDANSVDSDSLSPILDASGDELWFEFAPDACSEFGFDDEPEVRIGREWSHPGGIKKVD
jgi:hypothetical protein